MNLIFEYLYIQFSIGIVFYYSLKRIKRLWDEDEKNNGYGIGSSFGLLLILVFFSIVAFYSNIILKISFGEYFYKAILNMF